MFRPMSWSGSASVSNDGLLVLGVDPGLADTGYGAVRRVTRPFCCCDHAHHQPDRRPTRLPACSQTPPDYTHYPRHATRGDVLTRRCGASCLPPVLGYVF